MQHAPSLDGRSGHAASRRGKAARGRSWVRPGAALGVVLGLLASASQAYARFPVHLQTIFASRELDEIRAIAVSPDGAHVYLASDFSRAGTQHAAAVVALEVAPLTGEVTIIETVTEGVDVPDVTESALDIAVSPDGAHVYVAVYRGRLAVFSRDGVSGTLTLVEVEEDGVGGVTNMSTPSSVTVSPDGAQVYVTSETSASSVAGSVVVFARDAVTGALSFLEAHVDGQGGVDGLARANDMVVSADGAHAYVIGGVGHLVVVFTRNLATGALTFVEAQSDVDFPTSLTISPDGGHVYVTSSSDYLRVFSRNPTTGQLTLVETQSNGVGGVTGLENPWEVIVSPDGAHVFVAAFDGLGAGGVTVFDRDAGSGSLTFVEAHTQDPVEGSVASDCLAISSDGDHVYAGAGQAVKVFERASATGSLTYVGEERGAVLGLPTAAAISPDGASIYTVYQLNGELGVFSRDDTTGSVTFLEAHINLEKGITGLKLVDGVVVSPDGAHVYAIGDGVVVFDRDPGTGRLTFVEAHVNLGCTLETIAISPDGAHVYVPTSFACGGLIFSRDAATGELTAENNGLVFRGDSVAFSPDGAQVFMTDFDRLRVYDRDAATGALTLVDSEDPTIANGLDEATSVAVSPDGLHVYTASFSLVGTASVFRREPDGGVAFVQRKDQASRDVDHQITRARSVTLSPDGGLVYVTSLEGLTLFSRTADTGKLTKRAALLEGVDGVENGFLGSGDVLASPDGEHVYIVGGGALTSHLTATGFVSTCPAAPAIAGCRSAGRSAMVIKDHPNDNADTAIFRWTRGQETLLGDFGDPIGGATDYFLCVYHGPGSTLLLESNAPSAAQCTTRPCWDQGNDRILYRDGAKRPDGMGRLLLRAGGPDRATLTATARGPHLDVSASPPLELPLTAQILNSDGECWSTTFVADDVRKNDALPGRPAIFRARQ